MLWICWILLFLSSVGIAYQDFKTRWISIWLIVCFGAANLSLYLLTKSSADLFSNGVFCLSYFLFCYLILHLFYFLKTKKFQRILDDKIGWGDILLFLLIGCSIEPVEMIYFFTFSFVVAVSFQLLFLRAKNNIALGGMLVICYGAYLVYYNLRFLS